MRTGRPRSFCVEETLDRAMTVFWRHGYEGASMSDLTAAMGINSPSLYACFGSKEGLFRAVLQRYDERRKKFMEDVVAAYYCALDTRTPTRVRGVLLAALAYFVLPTDFIPDFIFGLGFTDDVAVLTAAITALRSHITPAHRAAAREALFDAG